MAPKLNKEAKNEMDPIPRYQPKLMKSVGEGAETCFPAHRERGKGRKPSNTGVGDISQDKQQEAEGTEE